MQKKLGKLNSGPVAGVKWYPVEYLSGARCNNPKWHQDAKRLNKHLSGLWILAKWDEKDSPEGCLCCLMVRSKSSPGRQIIRSWCGDASLGRYISSVLLVFSFSWCAAIHDETSTRNMSVWWREIENELNVINIGVWQTMWTKKNTCWGTALRLETGNYG